MNRWLRPTAIPLTSAIGRGSPVRPDHTKGMSQEPTSEQNGVTGTLLRQTTCKLHTLARP